MLSNGFFRQNPFDINPFISQSLFIRILSKSRRDSFDGIYYEGIKKTWVLSDSHICSTACMSIGWQGKARNPKPLKGRQSWSRSRYIWKTSWSTCHVFTNPRVMINDKIWNMSNKFVATNISILNFWIYAWSRSEKREEMPFSIPECNECRSFSASCLHDHFLTRFVPIVIQ